jgi:hypothetical protein
VHIFLSFATVNDDKFSIDGMVDTLDMVCYTYAYYNFIMVLFIIVVSERC